MIFETTDGHRLTQMHTGKSSLLICGFIFIKLTFARGLATIRALFLYGQLKKILAITNQQNLRLNA
ncbi:hypothetical protein SAMD00079811_32850 [Scytonema sp. HK-05]|nr:hypothetical protein NIES2130_22430 [Scytonema sp. HK-05]BAY45678.1 hypothetical protein SAMD00079811_32850 [Scytonema sp. HK-05]